MTLLATLRAATYLARDIPPALRRLLDLRSDDAPTRTGFAEHYAEVLADREAGEEVSEPRGSAAPPVRDFTPTSSPAEPPSLAADDGPGDDPTPSTPSPGPTQARFAAADWLQHILQSNGMEAGAGWCLHLADTIYDLRAAAQTKPLTPREEHAQALTRSMLEDRENRTK